MKKLASLMLAFTILIVMTGCSNTIKGSPDETFNPSATGEKTTSLTICLDEAKYELELKALFERFASEHPEIELIFELIPSGGIIEDQEPERQNVISRLQTQLMAGRGPDIYFIDTTYAVTSSSIVLPDIRLSMESGVFCDVVPLLESVGVSIDEFIAPVVAAGQINGNQCIMPIRYSLNFIVTNDSTYELMGSGFQTAADTIDNLIVISQTPGAFSHTLSGVSSDVRKITSFFNPFYLSSPAIVDYDTRTVTVDSDFTRNLLTKAMTLEKNTYEDYNNKLYTGNATDESWTEWNEYVKSDKYIILDSYPGVAMQEAGYLEHVGMTPHVNALPSQDGGAHALITFCAGIRNNSEHKREAAELLKFFLSEEIQRSAAARGSTELPVRKGMLSEIADMFVNEGINTYSCYNPKGAYFFSAPLSDECKQQFCEIEDNISGTSFRIPVEAGDILREYYAGELDLDSAVTQMQQYMENSLWAAS